MHTREPENDFLLLRKLLQYSLCRYITDPINDLTVVIKNFVSLLNSIVS